MRFSTTPAMVVEVTHSSMGSIYFLHQFKTLFRVSHNLTAMSWENVLADPDTVQKKVVLQDLLKALYIFKIS